MDKSTPSSRRSGRRRGTTQTRETIAAVARSQFAERGYERATMRSVAEEAGVDPGLIVHFFGTKEVLFEEVMAMPKEMADILAGLNEIPPHEVGRRVAEVVAAILETPASRDVVIGRIRAAASHPNGAAMVRELVTRDFGPRTSGSAESRETRSLLIGVMVTGLVTVRHIAGIEPLASMPASQLADLIAPVLQRLLVEPADG